MMSSLEIERLKEALASANLEYVFEHFKVSNSDIQKQILALQFRYSKLSERITNGTVSDEFRSLETNRIVTGILNVLSELELSTGNSKVRLKEIREFNRSERGEIIDDNLNEIINLLISTFEVDVVVPDFNDSKDIAQASLLIKSVNDLKIGYHRFIDSLDPELELNQKRSTFTRVMGDKFQHSLEESLKKMNDQSLYIRIYVLMGEAKDYAVADKLLSGLTKQFEKSNSAFNLYGKFVFGLMRHPMIVEQFAKKLKHPFLSKVTLYVYKKY